MQNCGRRERTAIRWVCRFISRYAHFGLRREECRAVSLDRDDYFPFNVP